MTWDELVETALDAHPEARRSQMFGEQCVKRDTGKVAFCAWKDAGVVFKFVDADARDAALALEGAELFDPGMGRRMKEWVLVPVARADRWLALAEQALAD
jgi:hypothetical protein